MRTALLVTALLFGAACKRDQPVGTPPGGEWEPAPQAMPPRNPNDPANPSSAQMGGNPHGGMNPGGGVPQGEMPNDDVHSRAQMGGGGADPSNPHGGAAPTPTGPPQIANPTAPRTLEKLADGRHVLGPFTFALPADWTIKPVTSDMRAAHFVLSEKAGEEAEMIVFYQGEGGMGPVQANLDRWAGQVNVPEGKPVTEKIKVADQDASYMTVHGDFFDDMKNVAKKSQTLIGVIITSPSGPYYFKLVGAKKTVEANTAKIKGMFASMKLKT